MGELMAAARRTWDMNFGGRVHKRMEDVPGPRPECEQMEQYADAFYGLAGLFQKMPCQRERFGDRELEEVFASVKEEACAGCAQLEQCWDGAYFQTCRILYGLLEDLESRGSFSGEQESILSSECQKPKQVETVLQRGYEEARASLLWSNRMMEQRRAAGEQIYQTAELLHRTARSFEGQPQKEERIAKRLRRELAWMKIELGGIRVFSCDRGRTEIYLTLRARQHRAAVSVKTVAEALSECCKETMRPAWNCRAAVCEEPMLYHFVPDTRYQFFCGIARITKTGEMVSGDNYAFLQKDTGKIVMSLADGMGSGVGACRESEKVIELLEQFLNAGFPQETAVRMINSCMLLQNRSQIFSTIDLCMTDLYNANCDMIKFGAASSFIRRAKGIEVIRSGAFPAGVLQQSDYESMHRRLESGTSIVMMTDGVLDALPEENREQAMADLIEKTAAKNAQEYARRLMERVYLMQKFQARDDMTVLIGTIWEK